MSGTSQQIEPLLPMGPHGGRLTEDFAHEAIHNGEVFRAAKYEIIGAGSMLSVMMTTPANGGIHLSQTVSTDGPGLGQFFEAPNATGGTVITAKNAYRSSTNVSSAVVASDPTIVSNGTAIGVALLGDTGWKSVSGGSMLSREWILAASTKYLLKFTSDAASCRTIIKIFYIEET